VLYRCYAKVNLTLEIVGKRADGYHELASLVHTINLADDLRIVAADELLTRIEGLDIEPTANLVARAAALFASATRERRGAELSLVKRIPAAAGLGGGSTDAAATLGGLNTFWQRRIALRDLLRLGAELGSDVPFFIRGGAALMRGRGEKLRRLPPLAGQWLVLLVPPHDVTEKTRRLYEALQPSDFTSGKATSSAAACLERGEPIASDFMLNGFERAARSVFPGLSDVWDGAEALSRRRFFLSGAGPSIFALAANAADARTQAARLDHLDGATYAVRTVKRARVATR
jgi:4-diphosphocytidyl-2-C-methyl-D-erythritol kinase